VDRKDHLVPLETPVITEHLARTDNQVVKDHLDRLDRAAPMVDLDRKDHLATLASRHLAKPVPRVLLVHLVRLARLDQPESLARMATPAAKVHLVLPVTKAPTAVLERLANLANQELQVTTAQKDPATSVHLLVWHLVTDKG